LARASTVDVIFSRANGASSVVPGAVDLSGNPAETNFFSLNEFFLSPDGTKWVLRAVTMQASSQNQVLLEGGGLTGSVVLQKGQPFPGAITGEVLNFPSALTGSPFNANNDWAVGIRTTGGNPSIIYKILRYTGDSGALRFQQGDPYAASAANEHVGTSIDSIHLRNDGVIGWRDSTSTGDTYMPITASDAVRFRQANADTVMAIDGSGPVNISSIIGTGDIADFLTSVDGSVTLLRIKADLNADHSPNGDPDAIVRNGQIVAQVGQPLPGAPTITVSTLDQVSLAPNNDWYMRGTYAGGAWATKNGLLIAKTGDAVGDHAWGAPYTFSGNLQSSFYAVGGNSNGDWVIVGRTDNPDASADDVVVVNGQVVLSEGDPVPVDNNNDGVLDTVYVGRGNGAFNAFAYNTNTPVGLAPDRTLYVMANLRTANMFGVDVAPTFNTFGTALLRVTPGLPPCCRIDFNGDGSVGTDADIEDFFACLSGACCPTCPPNADFNCDGGVGTDADIESFFRVLSGGNC
jgi:hypothetical protein